MNAFTSSGWSIRPAFTPHSPNSPVSLEVSEEGLGQLTGVYPEAFSTPWEEISSLELVRQGRTMALFATVGGVRYRWQNRSLEDFEEMRALVLERGGTLRRRRRRAGALTLVIAVLAASSGGIIAALLTHSNNELSLVKSANLTIKDLPAGFVKVGTSILSYVTSPPGEVITSTSTTQPPAGSEFARAAGVFQSCMGVTDAADRVYGKAGQLPDYQVSSPVFTSNNQGGMQVASVAQYYASSDMVNKDVAEMSQRGFGACFARSNADLLVSGLSGTFATVSGGTNWTPVTYARAWARGGVIRVSVPGVGVALHLVIVVTAEGHYEVTLAALVARWPQSESLVASLVNTIKVRMLAPSASSAV